jgi:hypothetical protein
MHAGWRGRAGAVAAVILGAASAVDSARAAPPEEVPLADVLDIVILERQLLAIDANNGGETTADLELGESVVWSGSRGKVGVVLTDRRILAVSDRSAFWQAEHYRRTEQVVGTPLLGDRVALATTSERVLGFNGTSSALVEAGLGPRETVVASRAGENVAVVVTSRRALGLSPEAGGFFPVKLDLNERIEDVVAKANVATIRTSRRLLIFRTPTATWEERLLDLGD